MRCSVRRRSSALQGQGAGPYPDPDFRQLDSWIVIREDNTATFYVGKTDLGQGTGTAFRQIMSDELDIAYDRTSCRHGQHRRHRRSGRIGRLGCASDRRVADAARGGRGSARAARAGISAVWRAGRPARRQRGRDLGRRRSLEESHLRRADRRKAVQRHADGQQRRRDHRCGQAQDGAGAQDRRPVAAALRHSRQGGRLAEMGRRRQASRHGSRAQREAAGRGREARQHRRILRSRHAWIRQGGEQGQLRRRRLRAGRAGDPRGPAAQGQLAEAGDRAVPDLGRSAQVHARRDAHVERRAERGRESRRGAGRRGEGHRGRIRRPVPGAHVARSGACHWPIRRTIR